MQHRTIEILEVPCLILHLLRVVVSNVLRAGRHLLLHEVLGRGESRVPSLQLGQDIVNVGVLYVATESALHVQRSLLLVQPCFEELVLEAENDFVFQLADVVDAQGLHELVVGHDGLPGGNIGDGDELEFPDLRGFQL